MENMSLIKSAIEKGRTKEAEQMVQAAIRNGVPAEELIHDALIPAIRSAGDHYTNEGSDIFSILAAARCTRKCLDILLPYMRADEREERVGTVIVGTIEGDLHEVGKNLVCTMMESAGITVIDLGVDISGREFLRALREHPEAGCVCISSLLTTSEQTVRQVVKLIRKEHPEQRIRIMVGGGSITEEFAQEIGADAYTENAVEAAAVARQFLLAQQSGGDQ